MSSFEQIYEEWERALGHAYSFARGARLGMLRGRRVRTFTDQGLHPFSVEVGRILALQEIEPLLREADFNVVQFAREAERDADKEFREEVLRDAQHS